jgi:hypothetical protein
MSASLSFLWYWAVIVVFIPRGKYSYCTNNVSCTTLHSTVRSDVYSMAVINFRRSIWQTDEGTPGRNSKTWFVTLSFTCGFLLFRGPLTKWSKIRFRVRLFSLLGKSFLVNSCNSPQKDINGHSPQFNMHKIQSRQHCFKFISKSESTDHSSCFFERSMVQCERAR